MVRFTERQNNTREQVVDYITTALEITVEVEPHPDLMAAVFTKAVDLLASKQIVMEQPQQIGVPGGFAGLR